MAIGYRSERPAIVRSLQRMVCTSCGAEANASCNCGKPYVPAAARVAEYDKANPGQSTRQAAADLGVSKSEVNRARQSAVPDGTPETVTGRDGKQYPATRPVDELKTQVNEFHRQIMNFYSDYDRELRAWRKEHDLTSEQKSVLMEAIYLAADGLQKLAQAIDDR